MNRIHNIIWIFLACALCSCTDISRLEEEIEDVRQEISELSRECEAINSRIEALQNLVTQIQARETITGITEIRDEHDDVVGYVVTFRNAEAITFYLPGTLGRPYGGNPPVISVVEDEDGVWWTMGGEYILDESGNKVSAGRGNVTPKLKVEDGRWYLSLDGGRTWSEAGSSDDMSMTGVVSVVDGDEDVLFTLSDGTSFSVPKSKAANLSFSYNRNVVRGVSVSVQYKFSSSTGVADVTAFGNRYVRKVSIDHRPEYGIGFINVDLDERYDVASQKVFVYLDYGDGVIVKELVFTEYGTFDIEAVPAVPSAGGEVKLNITSDGYQSIDTKVVQGGNWLSASNGVFVASANTDSRARTAAIRCEARTSAMSRDANFSKTVYVVQLGTGAFPCYEEYVGFWKHSGNEHVIEVRFDQDTENGYMVYGLTQNSSEAVNAVYDSYSGTMRVSSSSETYQLGTDKNTMTCGSAIYDRQGLPEYFADGDFVMLNEASAGYTPLNLVILGDGYQVKDLRKGGVFQRHASSAMDAFFGWEPFRSFRDRFNVYMVAYESKDAGVDNYSQGSNADTYFDVWWNGNSTAMWVSDAGRDKVIDVVKNRLGLNSDAQYYRTIVLVLSNIDAVAGSCGYPYRDRYGSPSVTGEDYASFAIAVVPANTMATKGLVRHEMGGHGFGRLGDEYESKTYGSDLADWHAKGFYRNVTVDRDSWNWDHFIGRSGYEDTGYIWRNNNYWCPSERGIMYNNEGNFNAPCRQIIYERIIRQTEGAGAYTLDRFLEYDSRNI